MTRTVVGLGARGVPVVLVVGGGSLFQGSLGEKRGTKRAEADSVGILGTVMNGLMLRGVLDLPTATTKSGS